MKTPQYTLWAKESNPDCEAWVPKVDGTFAKVIKVKDRYLNLSTGLWKKFEAFCITEKGHRPDE